MSPSWRRIARVAAVFATVGWLAAVCIGATEDEVSWIQAFRDGVHLRAAGVGALSAVVWGPVWALGRPPTWLGPLLALVAGACGIYLYFFAFPHEWQGDRLMAWKSSKVVLGTYYPWLAPLFLTGGGVCSWWVRRPVPTASWEKLAEEQRAADRAAAELPTAAVVPVDAHPTEGDTASLPVPPPRPPEANTEALSAVHESRLRESATLPLPPTRLGTRVPRPPAPEPDLADAIPPAAADSGVRPEEEGATERVPPSRPPAEGGPLG